MKEKDLLHYCRYYKGQNEPPKEYDYNSKLWWEGEKLLLEKCQNPNYWIRLEKEYHTARKENALSGKLIDDSIPEKKRLILYFLDLWHGRSFPYDSLDFINNY